MLEIGIIPATLIAGAAAVWLGVSSLVVLVVCAVTIAIAAIAVSGDSRTYEIACTLIGATLFKVFVFENPLVPYVLHVNASALSSFSDWLIGGIAAISIPLSGWYGIYTPLNRRTRLNLFGGSVRKLLVTFAAWLALSGALYAHFSGRDLVAALVAVIALALFIMSFRVRSETETSA
ncbi:hypothetical protein [Burkholderia diffusa]|uniref:hypothetical protein n=1 Tax=Burkholderia diffusa TaxID=488732 RepID=UPI00158BE51C|nr:hypothetical protein [Burkholderia diffusa]